MADYTPIVHPDKKPPYAPRLSQEDGFDIDRLAWDQSHQMWINPGVRRRTYVCSKGIEHHVYWRTIWRQGREDYVACEHEVAPPNGGDGAS